MASPSPRRFLQISLRTLLIAMTLVGVATAKELRKQKFQKFHLEEVEA